MTNHLRAMTKQETLLALEYLPNAKWFAKAAKRQHPQLDFEEIISACYFALCLATQKWQPTRADFLTCLKWQVRLQIRNLRAEERPKGFKCLARHPWDTIPKTSMVIPWQILKLAE